MIRKEFEALLAIEGSKLRTWAFNKDIWIAEVINPNDNYPVNYCAGSTESEALNLLIHTHYANNRK